MRVIGRLVHAREPVDRPASVRLARARSRAPAGPSCVRAPPPASRRPYRATARSSPRRPSSPGRAGSTTGSRALAGTERRARRSRRWPVSAPSHDAGPLAAASTSATYHSHPSRGPGKIRGGRREQRVAPHERADRRRRLGEPDRGQVRGQIKARLRPRPGPAEQLDDDRVADDHRLVRLVDADAAFAPSAPAAGDPSHREPRAQRRPRPPSPRDARRRLRVPPARRGDPRRPSTPRATRWTVARHPGARPSRAPPRSGEAPPRGRVRPLRSPFGRPPATRRVYGPARARTPICDPWSLVHGSPRPSAVAPCWCGRARRPPTRLAEVAIRTDRNDPTRAKREEPDVPRAHGEASPVPDRRQDATRASKRRRRCWTRASTR